MKDFFNAYEILKVKKGDSEAVIRKAWLVARSKHHPDKGGKEEDFKQYKLAWEILSSDARRRNHDSEIESIENAKNNRFTQNSQRNAPQQTYTPDYNSNILYQIHATYRQLIEIMGNSGFCQFQIDGELIQGHISLKSSELIAYNKIYQFYSDEYKPQATSIKFTWDWETPWEWNAKYGQTYNLYMTESQIRQGGRKTINMPDGRRIAFSWKSLGKEIQIKGGLWVKLKNQGWPNHTSLSPDAWVHLNPISKYKSFKNSFNKVFGDKNRSSLKGYKGDNVNLLNVMASVPTIIWKLLIVMFGLAVLSHYAHDLNILHLG
jgi:curved DNA-binding protein CbpA